jgi:acyl dehydratase
MTTTSDVITGRVRQPRNLAAHIVGSIHDDDTATALGFRGGTVAGSVHLDQFPPLLIQAFGQPWFETGSLSLYFRHATTDGEAVQAFVERPPAGAHDRQVRAWMTTPRSDSDESAASSQLVAEGTAAVGNPRAASALHERDLRPADPAELKILKALKAGDVLGDLRAAVNSERQRSIIDDGAMTEPLDWYSGRSPWGGPIASPSGVVGLLYTQLLAETSEAMGEHVGLFGAIEIRFRAGPVFLDRDYRVTGEVAAVSQTPRTEVLWFDSRALDDRDEPVVEMRMMLREMKQSSPLYGGHAAGG